VDQGFYAELAITAKKPNVDKTFDVILHFRNVAKCKDKNISISEAEKVLAILQGLSVGLVGNDEKIIGENLGSVIDLRNKLSLGEIAWLMQRAKLFVGKDSGVAHLAGVCNVPYLIGWNYVSKKWFPKTRSKGDYFISREGFDEALRAIKRFLINGL
jgi:ADP-heptose:LPS heptosyltransferase